MTTKHRNRQGQALLICLLLLTVIGGILGVMLHEVRALLDSTETERSRLQARYAAESGLEFALQELNRREWDPEVSEWMLDSRAIKVPGFDSESSFFLVRFERAPLPRTNGAHPLGPTPVWQMTSTGHHKGIRRSLQIQASDPSDLTRYLWNITSFDFESQSFRNATVDFGNDGAAVRGVIEQVVKAPDSGQVTLACTADRYFAGVVPGSLRVISANGEELAIGATNSQVQGRAGQPSEQGASCVVDYASGTVTFPKAASGQSFVIFHDYYHRVPLPPGPFVFSLPYIKVQPGSEVVRDLSGQAFFQDPVQPRMQNHFSLLPDRGLVFFSEHNTWQPLQVDYAFRGSRTTGPIHINGSIRWHERNLLCLLGQREDAIEVTGDFEYAPESKVFLANEGQTINVRQEGADGYREGVGYRLPVPVDWHFYRRMADPKRGGDGRYIANPEERQDPDEAIQEWKNGSSNHWSGVRYEPPGTVVVLSEEEIPPNGLIFAEGNLRIRGTPESGSKLTVVSEGSIYLEDELDLDNETSVALIARDHVCLNTTQLSQVLLGLPSASVRALIYAVRGTFGVVPPRYAVRAGARRNQLFFLGAITENRHYDSSEWSRAFGALEWLYDARLRDPRHRPPWLSGLLLKHWDWHDGLS